MTKNDYYYKCDTLRTSQDWTEGPGLVGFYHRRARGLLTLGTRQWGTT